MNDSPATLSRPVVPPDVQAFVAEKGLNRYLPTVVALAQEAFPSSALCKSLGQDAEDETHRYIALDVESSGLAADELLAGQRIWSTGINRVCPPRYAVYFVVCWQ